MREQVIIICCQADLNRCFRHQLCLIVCGQETTCHFSTHHILENIMTSLEWSNISDIKLKYFNETNLGYDLYVRFFSIIIVRRTYLYHYPIPNGYSKKYQQKRHQERRRILVFSQLFYPTKKIYNKNVFEYNQKKYGPLQRLKCQSIFHLEMPAPTFTNVCSQSFF